MRLLTVRSWVRDPREAFFIKKKKKQKGYGEKEKIKVYSKRAHSSVVERRTAVPAVIGSNPIVPFVFSNGKRGRKKEERKKRKDKVYRLRS